MSIEFYEDKVNGAKKQLANLRDDLKRAKANHASNIKQIERDIDLKEAEIKKYETDLAEAKKRDKSGSKAKSSDSKSKSSGSSSSSSSINAASVLNAMFEVSSSYSSMTAEAEERRKARKAAVRAFFKKHKRAFLIALYIVCAIIVFVIAGRVILSVVRDHSVVQVSQQAYDTACEKAFKAKDRGRMYALITSNDKWRTVESERDLVRLYLWADLPDSAKMMLHEDDGSNYTETYKHERVIDYYIDKQQYDLAESSCVTARDYYFYISSVMESMIRDGKKSAARSFMNRKIGLIDKSDLQYSYYMSELKRLLKK